MEDEWNLSYRNHSDDRLAVWNMSGNFLTGITVMTGLQCER